MRTPAQEFLEHCSHYSSFAVVSHKDPDGDAIGSTIALTHILLALGKQVVIYNISKTPNDFTFLPVPAPLVHSVDVLKKHPVECIVIADCGAQERIGKEHAALMEAYPQSILIDHHVNTEHFATVFNWVDSKAAATCELIAQIAQAAELPLQGVLGESLYLGLATDTGFFSYSNTRPITHTLAAEIITEGLDPGLITEKFDNQWSVNKMHLWGALMNKLETYFNDAVAVATIPNTLLQEYNCTKDDLEGFASFIRHLAGIRISILLREDDSHATKASLRSSGSDNVQAIAVNFGGGGHKNAAGLNSSLPLDELKQELLKIIEATFTFHDNN